MSRDTATELEESSHGQGETPFDLSSSRLSPRQDAESSAVSPAHLQIHEGYGFRSASGVASPQLDVRPEIERPAKSPIPDEYGLGWPGVSLSSLFWWFSDYHHWVNRNRYSQIYLISSQLHRRGTVRARG